MERRKFEVLGMLDHEARLPSPTHRQRSKKTILTLALLVLSVCAANSLALTGLPRPTVSRRTALVQSVCVAATAVLIPGQVSAATSSASGIAGRLEKDTLTIPPPSVATELNGVDNLYFPDYMAGEWLVTQTLVDVSTPLGLKFAGGPNGLESIAEKSMEEARTKLNQPVSLRLRYIPTKWGVAEDRLFNSRQRLDAFAGKSVVASVEYANVGGSNRQSVLAMGGTEEDPLQTSIVRFKGPAAQKTFVVSHGSERVTDDTASASWAGYELDRSIFALTNQNTAPPLTTDTELIWYLEKVDDVHVRAKLRIAGYLNAQSDTLYFNARNRAVTLQDYVLDMKRRVS